MNVHYQSQCLCLQLHVGSLVWASMAPCPLHPADFFIFVQVRPLSAQPALIMAKCFKMDLARSSKSCVVTWPLLPVPGLTFTFLMAHITSGSDAAFCTRPEDPWILDNKLEWGRGLLLCTWQAGLEEGLGLALPSTVLVRLAILDWRRGELVLSTLSIILLVL
jgi:hypothetical protein